MSSFYGNSGGGNGSSSIKIDDTLTKVGQAADAYAAGKIVAVSDTEPEDTSNKIWIKENVQEVQVPTMIQFNELATRVDKFGSPLTALTVADMTDHTRVYVYIGSETGYTAGNWYYWNGTAWTSGGVYNSTALQTDTTLAIPSMAADAKSTGDAIGDLDDRQTISEGEITQIKSDLNLLETDFKGELKTQENITFVYGYYINLRDGDTININTPIEDYRYKYAIVNCSEGDKFLINAYGGSAPLAYGFVDSNNAKLYVSGANTNILNQTVTAPANSAKIIINDRYQSSQSGEIYSGDLPSYKIIKTEVIGENFVRFDKSQEKTSEEKATARANIGVDSLLQGFEDIIEVISGDDEQEDDESIFVNLTLKNIYADSGIAVSVDDMDISVTANTSSSNAKFLIHNNENYLQNILESGSRYRMSFRIVDFSGSNLNLSVATFDSQKQENSTNVIKSPRRIGNGRQIIDWVQDSSKSTIGFFVKGSDTNTTSCTFTITDISIRKVETYNALGESYTEIYKGSGVTTTKINGNTFDISLNTTGTWITWNARIDNNTMVSNKRYTIYAYVTNYTGNNPMTSVVMANGTTTTYNYDISGWSTSALVNSGGIFAKDFIFNANKTNAICLFLTDGSSGRNQASFRVMFDIEEYIDSSEPLPTPSGDKEYSAIDKIARGLIEDISIISTGVITPEEYGAKGDGVTDDTTAIQTALNNAANKNCSITFGSGKIYCISSTLSVTKRFPIYGNNAVIIVTSDIDKAILIHTQDSQSPWSPGIGLINDLTINCNNKANIGIYCEYSWEYYINNVDIGKAKTRGISLNGGCEWFLNNIRINTVLDTDVGTGIYVATSDSHFANIVVINARIGMSVRNGLTSIYGLHVWNTTASIVKNSVMAEIFNSPVQLSNCYSDTCASTIKINGSQFVTITGLMVHFNRSYINSSIMDGNNIYLFELVNNASPSRVKGSGISATDTASGLGAIFSNIAKSNWTNYDWRKNNDPSLVNLFSDYPD